MQLFSMYLFYYLYLKMEKFVVFGRYCEDAIIKREPFREQHLNRLKNLKDCDILVTLGPTKCTKYLFGIFNAKDKNELKNLIKIEQKWLINIKSDYRETKLTPPYNQLDIDSLVSQINQDTSK